MRFFKSTMFPHCDPKLKSHIVHVLPGSTDWGHRNLCAIDWNDDHKAGALAGNGWQFEQDPCNRTSHQRFETLTCTSTKIIEITGAWVYSIRNISCIELNTCKEFPVQNSYVDHLRSAFISLSEYHPSSFRTITFFFDVMIFSISSINFSWRAKRIKMRAIYILK